MTSRSKFASTCVVLLLLSASACSPPAAPSTTSTPTAAPASPSATAAKSSITGANRWIAYQSLGASGLDSTFIVRTDGSNDHEILTELPGERRHPDFSRDGMRLTFDQLNGSPPDQTYVADSDGSAPELLAKCTGKCMQHYEPAWSPEDA